MDKQKEIKMGEFTHTLELMEMNFLREQGINPNYNDVENHIAKIIKKFEKQFEDNLNIDFEEYEITVQDLDDKINAIESAISHLSLLKKNVSKMKESRIKEFLLMSIEKMEMDLC